MEKKVLAWGVRLDLTPWAKGSARSARPGGKVQPYPLDEDFSRTAHVEQADLKDPCSIPRRQFPSGGTSTNWMVLRCMNNFFEIWNPCVSFELLGEIDLGSGIWSLGQDWRFSIKKNCYMK